MEQKRRAAKKRRDAAPVSASSDKGNGGDKKQEAFDLMLGTLEALVAGDPPVENSEVGEQASVQRRVGHD